MNLLQGDLRAELHKYRKKRTLEIFQFYGLLTSKLRMFPEFIIIGTQRSGTTSLYNYLAGHPYILSAVKKEVHFFDMNFNKGMNWYRAYFPFVSAQKREPRIITGEASPYYIFHPHAPLRIASLFPSMKLIILLRNPVDRAYSHYQHEVKLKHETLSFEEAIEQEGSRIEGEIDKLMRDENYSSFHHRHYSYLSRGIYVNQLKNWRKLFPKEQIQIIKSEDFFDEPQKTITHILNFLNLPDWKLPDFKIHNRLQYTGMKAETRDRLNAYFKPFNQDLYDYLGTDFNWV